MLDQKMCGACDDCDGGFPLLILVGGKALCRACIYKRLLAVGFGKETIRKMIHCALAAASTFTVSSLR